MWRWWYYCVKCDVVLGIFYFIVFDNGVIFKEFWCIVDVKDDLLWGLFYYSGVVVVVG